MDNKKWYMITTISGREEKVIESLKNRAIAESMENVFDVEDGFKVFLIPHISPKELEKKNNNEDFTVRNKNLFPGYIFIKMEMTNEAWFIVRNTQYVTGLVGSSGQRAKPTPVSNLEIRRMERKAKKIREEFESGAIKSPFKVDDTVEVIEGATKGQIGKVLEVNDERQVAVVELILFERKTPTEIEYANLRIK